MEFNTEELLFQTKIAPDEVSSLLIADIAGDVEVEMR
jgi:hypothetical protein